MDKKEGKSSVVDLDLPITTWAKYHLDITDEQLISGDVRLEIDASKLRQVTKDLKCPDNKGKTSSTVTFNSTYRNNTNAQQEHVFIMERYTEAAATTSLSQGFTRNGSVGIKVAVPESVREVIGDFGSEVTISSDEENIVKHSLKWAIKSKVNVPEETTAVAKMIITERNSKFDFSASVILKGKILAKAFNTKTGRGWQTEGNISNILGEKTFNGNFKPGNGVDIDMNKKIVTWKVAGSLNFRFGISQDFQVDHE